MERPTNIARTPIVAKSQHIHTHPVARSSYAR
jgi:hypothetical protein